MNRRYTLGRYLGLWLFATALAYLEASAAANLRTLLGIDSGGPFMLAPYLEGSASWLVSTESFRKPAMLLVALIAAILFSPIGGYRFLNAVIVSSIWVAGHYAFLKLITGWPVSLFSYDVSYYVPTYWIAPVICSLLIAGSAVAGATLILYLAQSRIVVWPSLIYWILMLVGATLLMYAFMGDSAYYVAGGSPTRFPWTVFWTGYLLAVVPTLHFIYRLARKDRSRFR